MKKQALFLILNLVFAVNAGASKKPVMKLAAEVDQKILTSRDVEAHYIVTKLMQGATPVLPLSYDTDDFRLSLDQLVVESMVYSEASSFGIAKVPDEEIESAYKTTKQKINDSPTIKNRWQWLDFSDVQLREKITVRLRSSRLIKYKTESSDSQVGDQEAKEYYEKNRLKFGTMTFENFKPTIKKYIARKNSEERLREWFDVLKKKHRVKNLI